MEWRTIPGFPAYEINRAGIVRNAVTKYHLGKNGRRYRLSAGGTISNMHPYELVGMAFGDAGEPGPCVEAPATPDAERLAALERENRELRVLVAEMDAELQVYRVAI